MNWKFLEDRICATTEYGDYVITMVKGASEPTFEVCLHTSSEISMQGKHLTVGGAMGAAETDLNHRNIMWETL